MKTVAYTYHWTPKTLNKLYCDDFDNKGLIYWYDECVRISEIKPTI